VFAGSELIAADADLVASGLLVQLRVTDAPMALRWCTCHGYQVR
jgi:hypothetical protein